jgi:hypothetical protein
MDRTFRIKSEKKYSNINVFEKREKEFQMKMRELYNSKLKKKPKLDYGWLKKLIRRNSNFGIPILSTSTTYLISDKDTQLSLREKFFKRIKLDKNLLNNFKTKKSFNRKSLEKSNLFITESPILKTLSRNISSFNLTGRRNFNTRKRKKKLLTSSKSLENHKSFNYFMFNNFSSISNAKILLHFENEKILANTYGESINTNFSKKKKIPHQLIRMNSSDNFDKMLGLKVNKLNIKKDKTSKLINKTRQLKLFEYNIQLRKERSKRLKEICENNIEFLNEKMNSLRFSEELLNNKFIDKLSEYIKYINSRMEAEKDESIALINKIIKYKNDVKQLETKIEKKREEKNCILKWIYFQIQIKEKKICLPSYYKTIIEKNEPKKEEAKKKNIGLSFSKSSRQAIKKIFFIEANNSKKISPKTKQNKKLDNNLNNESKLFFHSSFDLNSPVNIEEINKIKYYRNHLIFNSVDQLEDVFVSMENKSIEMMKYYVKLKMEITYFKKELSKIKNSLQQNEFFNNNSYKTKEEEFNELKNYLIYQMKIMQKLNINKYRDSLSNDSNNKDNFYIYKKNNNENHIINKINVLYKTCKSLGIKFTIETDEEKQEKKQEKKNSKNTSIDIMPKLKFINFTIDYILTKFRNYDNKKKIRLKELRKEIERGHKIQNTIEQKIQNSKNFIEKQNKIIERNNKVYFLPYRKIDHYKNMNVKKNIDLYERKSQKIQFYDLID